MSREKRRTHPAPTGHNLHFATCEHCRKASYPDRSAARRAGRSLHPGRRLRAYACPFSDFWHVTSVVTS